MTFKMDTTKVLAWLQIGVAGISAAYAAHLLPAQWPDPAWGIACLAALSGGKGALPNTNPVTKV